MYEKAQAVVGGLTSGRGATNKCAQTSIPNGLQNEPRKMGTLEAQISLLEKHAQHIEAAASKFHHIADEIFGRPNQNGAADCAEAPPIASHHDAFQRVNSRIANGLEYLDQALNRLEQL